MIRPLYIVTSLFSGLVCHLLLILVFGSTGSQALAFKTRYLAELESNLGMLEQKGEALESEYYYLRDDPGAIIREAGRIGYIFPDQTMLQLSGREPAVEAMSPGEILSLRAGPGQERTLIRSIAFSVSVVVFVLLLMGNPGESGSRGSGEPGSERVGAAGSGKTAFASFIGVQTARGSVGSDLEMAQSIRIQVAARE